MLGIDYSQNGAGRSGHRLKDLFSSVNLAVALGARALFHESWKGQFILPIEGVRRVLDPPAGIASNLIRLAPSERHWGGISIDEFRRLRSTVAPFLEASEFSVLRVSDVYRLHLAQLHDWTVRGWLRPDAHATALSLLRRMYWGEAIPQRENGLAVRRIVIHARRGDIADPSHPDYSLIRPGGLWGRDFYNKVVADLLAEHPGARIELFCEDLNSEDLTTLEGVSLRLGTTDSLTRDFRSIVTSDLFVPSSSSLATWAAYITTGRVRVYNLAAIKHFQQISYPNNFEIVN